MTVPLDAPRALFADLMPAAPSAPAGSGRLAELAAWLRDWPADAGPGRSNGARVRPLIALYVSAAEPEPDAAARGRARLEHLAAGGGAVSALARAQGAGVELFDLAIERPAPDARLHAALSAREAAATFAFGMEALAKSPDLLVLGDATPGSARAAAALGCALAQGDPAAWSEPEDIDWCRATASRAATAAAGDPLRLLCEIGGRETAALLGALVAARVQRVPVLVDGAPALAAASVFAALRPDALDHVRVAHRPALACAPGFMRGLGRSLLDLDLATGDGEGGAAALSFVRLAAQLEA